MHEPIKVIIADDHMLVRQGIRAFLDTCDDIVIVGEADSAVAAAALCISHSPDVALVDMIMPGGGVEATRLIRSGSPATQVLILTSFEDDLQIVQAVQAGALSYLLKDADADTLAHAIRRTAIGESILHARIATRLVQAMRAPASDAVHSNLESLTQREQEVLGWMADGLSNQHIAERMGIAGKTVKTHVSNVLAKLQLKDRTQAAVYAWRAGVKR